MRRRDFIGVIYGPALALPSGADAQQAGKVWRIGQVTVVGPEQGEPFVLEVVAQIFIAEAVSTSRALVCTPVLLLWMLPSNAFQQRHCLVPVGGSRHCRRQNRPSRRSTRR
jgi:hypothetical protein